MASETDDDLRESARNRGLRLVKSRRRKAGGDFGKFGLTDATGHALFGFGPDGLTATAVEIAGYLRGAMRNDWAEAAKGLPKRKAEPKPKVPIEPKLKKVSVGNLLARLPSTRRGEVFTELLARPGVRIERIVSGGQTTPADAPFVQDTEEWVLLLTGSAALRLEDHAEVELKPGDHLTIPAGARHWVTRTDGDMPTVWLAVHLG